MNFTNRISFFSLFALLCCIAGAQSTDYREQFQNLSDADKKKFISTINESKSLLKEKKYFESVYALQPASQLMPNHPEVRQIIANGDIQLERFEEASKVYASLLKEYPDNISYKFNLGETYFVRGEWNEALVHFKEVSSTLENNNKNSVYYLTEFKKYISYKKLGKTSEAKRISSNYDYKSDSPIYYFIKAYDLLIEGNDDEAKQWVAKANRIFRAPGATSIYVDALKTSGAL